MIVACLRRENVADRTSKDLDTMVHAGYNWDFRSMVIAEKVTAYGVRSRLPEIKCVCEEGGGAEPKSSVEVTKYACDGKEARLENATLAQRRTDVQSKRRVQQIERCMGG